MFITIVPSTSDERCWECGREYPAEYPFGLYWDDDGEFTRICIDCFTHSPGLRETLKAEYLEFEEELRVLADECEIEKIWTSQEAENFVRDLEIVLFGDTEF